MKLVIDIEANSLVKPSKIWCIVCKDVDTGSYHRFREVTQNASERQRFLDLLSTVDTLVGHNILGYDWPVLCDLLKPPTNLQIRLVDTLLLSRLTQYSRSLGHSLESYGGEFGLEKIKFNDFTKYSEELETYCVRDVDICYRLYRKFLPVLRDPSWAKAIQLEHDFEGVVNRLHDNGFHFDVAKAEKLLSKVREELAALDVGIHEAFPVREVLIREFSPKATKFGTVSKTSVPRSLWDRLAEYEVGKVYRHTRLDEFNPASHKQLIDVLHDAGWVPTDRTKTHVETERSINRLKRERNKSSEVDIQLQLLHNKMVGLAKYGWKINETNLSTLPSSAPASARILAKRILLESRRRTLTEWLSLVDGYERIHGKFYGIGAWTHRMSHQNPNTANIPNEYDIATGKKKLLGREMRALWRAPKNRLLVGVDAEAIQLRVFAHMIDDEELTNAIVNGKKSDKTDPHSLNQRVFGDYCKTRNAAKHSLYAIFFGGRANMVSHIMGCSKAEAEEAIHKLIERYPGLARLEQEVFPTDARRGYFIGLDGRKVPIPGDTISAKKHLCMSGYLQNGEAVVMKAATLKWIHLLKDYDAMLVNFVHDEWQTECPNDMKIALQIANLKADSLRIVGEELKMKCPLAGSFWNDDAKDYTIGTTWAVTH